MVVPLGYFYQTVSVLKIAMLLVNKGKYGTKYDLIKKNLLVFIRREVETKLSLFVSLAIQFLVCH